MELHAHESEPSFPSASWTVHPARSKPGRALLGLVIILGAAFAIAGWIEPPSWRLPIGLGVVGILFLSVNRFFLPTTFEVDEEGITARYPLRAMRCRWTELRRFLVGETSGLLSRRIRASSLDLFSGMQLLFDDKRDERVALIRSHMDRKGAAA